jgi:hypothetical protein
VVLGHSLDGTQDQLDHHRQENERQFHISKELNLQGRVTLYEAWWKRFSKEMNDEIRWS